MLYIYYNYIYYYALCFLNLHIYINKEQNSIYIVYNGIFTIKKGETLIEVSPLL